MAINSKFEMPVSIYALGGLGEVGKTCMFLKMKNILLFDAGVLFPEQDLPGIDYVIPDFAYLRDNARKIKALLLLTVTKTILGQSVSSSGCTSTCYLCTPTSSSAHSS